TESVANNRYRRTIAIDGVIGSVEVSPGRSCLVAMIRFPQVRALLSIVARLRGLFDLDANVEAIGAHLKRDECLAPLIARRPGLRSPGAFDGFEQAVRAILGDGVEVSEARRLGGALVARAGAGATFDVTGHEPLTHVFPTPSQLLAADLSRLGLAPARLQPLRALARIAAADKKLLQPTRTGQEIRARLRGIRGFGSAAVQDWALRASDAFPAADPALLRSPVVANGTPLSAKALLKRAEAWRPWRAYAAQHL